MIADPVISVVIPLPDDRGHLLDCLTGFTQQEIDVPFEVIVATAEEDSYSLGELPHQFPTVRWVHQSGLNVNALYNLAASAAYGTYLYVTESHCVPRRDCLRQIYEVVQRENVPAACSASDGINQNRIAEGEQRIFEEDFLSWIGDMKCKIAIRGTLILRSIWNDIGGFQSEFGHFSEMMIGAKLEAMGIRFGYAEKSIVSHVNQVCFQELGAELIEYGADECRANHLGPADHQVAYSSEWLQRESLICDRSRLERKRQREILRQRLRAWAFQWLPMSGKRRYQLFVQFWQGSIRLGRLRYLASMKAEDIKYDQHTEKNEPLRRAA